jgi:alpha-galactosidase
MSAMTRAGFVATAGLFLILDGCGRGTAIDELDGATSMDPVLGADGGSNHDAGAVAMDAATGDAQAARPDSGQPDRDAGGDGDAGPLDDGDWVPPVAPALAARPPMGWNSWNEYGCAVNETIIKSMADVMAGNGMRDAGYTYVNIDDCWATTRSGDGTLVADPNTFPSGIKAVADYVHERGLELGIYASRGTQTCAGRPGSQGHETKDAETYAAWGIDYVKYDNCQASMDMETQYQTMQSALGAAGRPMVFSICAGEFAEFMPEVGQLWRTTGTMDDNWGSMTSVLDRNAFYAAYAHPGAWNDADTLEVGNGGMTEAEYRAHFSLWAMMAAPLIASNDLTSMTPAIKNILTNAEVIAVDQDPWGYQGHRVRSDGGLEIWTRPLAGVGQRAVLFFNRTGSLANMTVSLKDLGLSPAAATVRDLWQHADLGTVSGQFTASVPSHDVVMLRVSGSEPPPPETNGYLSDLIWTYAANGWGVVERDKSVNDWYDHDGNTLRIAGTEYTKGLGVHGGSLIRYRLGGKCTRFKSVIGIDGEAGSSGSVVFKVHVDGVVRYQSGLLRGGMSGEIDLDLTGARELKLEVTSGGDGATLDHADWAVARVECAP